eukprot:21257_1
MYQKKGTSVGTRHSKKNYISFVMLGGGGVGKSSITVRFVANEFLDEYDPTVEDSYCELLTVNVAKDQYDNVGYIVPIKPQTVLVDILDTAGREEFSSMQDQWIRY